MENNIVEEKKSKKSVIICIVGLLIVLAIGFGVYFLFIKKDNTDSNIDDQNSSYYSKLSIPEYYSRDDNNQKSLHSGDDWMSSTIVYYFNCKSNYCKVLDDIYPNAVIRDDGIIKVYNVLTKETIETPLKVMDAASEYKINRVEASIDMEANLVYKDNKIYGFICEIDDNKFFYDYTEKKIYHLDNKYIYGFKYDIIDNRLWADNAGQGYAGWATDYNGMWGGGRYVIDYKSNKVLYDFGETEAGYTKLIIGNKEYYYANRKETNLLSDDSYNAVYNKNFKALFQLSSPDAFVINRVSNDDKLNIEYKNEFYEIDVNGNKKTIKKFDSGNGTIIGFNFDNMNAVAIQKNKVVLLNSENNVVKTIIEDYRPSEYEGCDYEGSNATFSKNKNNDEIVDIGILWVCYFDNYSHVTYNITKGVIEEE